MTTTTITSARFAVTFSAGNLPRVSPEHPYFRLAFGPVFITVPISAKTARKLTQHTGGGKLEGRLITRNGQLQLLDAGFQLEPLHGQHLHIRLRVQCYSRSG
jgi:hypothetical protein